MGSVLFGSWQNLASGYCPSLRETPRCMNVCVYTTTIMRKITNTDNAVSIDTTWRCRQHTRLHNHAPTSFITHVHHSSCSQPARYFHIMGYKDIYFIIPSVFRHRSLGDRNVDSSTVDPGRCFLGRSSRDPARPGVTFEKLTC